MNEWEYDPEYWAAERETLAGQARELSYAIQDMGNEIARAILPTLEMLPMLRAFGSELHADEFESWPWYRRWWHTLTGHRRNS